MIRNFEYHSAGIAVQTFGWKYLRLELWAIQTNHAQINRLLVAKIGLLKLAIGVVKP